MTPPTPVRAEYDCAGVKADFPVFARYPDLCYLDNAATTQCPAAVLAAVHRHEVEHRCNVARGVYDLAERATEAYRQARQTVAAYLGANTAAEVVFTSGTTAAINFAAQAFGARLNPGDEIMLSLAEHHSNLVPWQMLARRSGVRLRYLPLDADQRVDTGQLECMVTPRCRLIALTHASNVTGAVSDVAAAVEAARAVDARVLLDGAQMAPRGPLDLANSGVDCYALSGHKMYAPNGIGVWWVRRELLEDLPPVFGGGGLVSSAGLDQSVFARPPERFEAGTPPIAQAVGLAAAIEWLTGLDRAAMNAHISRLTERILSGLGTIPGLQVIGPADGERRIGVVSFVVDGVHPHDVCQVLNSHGVAARGGHHCAQPLLDALGVSGCTRVSLAAYNDTADVEALLAGLDDAVRRLR